MTLENWFGGLVSMVTGSRVMITGIEIGKTSANGDSRIEVDEEGHS